MKVILDGVNLVLKYDSISRMFVEDLLEILHIKVDGFNSNSSEANSSSSMVNENSLLDTYNLIESNPIRLQSIVEVIQTLAIDYPNIFYKVRQQPHCVLPVCPLRFCSPPFPAATNLLLRFCLFRTI
jgi:hypothetical protein